MGAYEQLSPRRQTFVDGVLEGMTYAEAYRQAGYDSNYSDQNGSRLARTDAVRSAIAQRREVVAKRSEFTADRLVHELLTNLNQARDAGQLSAANRALELLSRHLGFVTERSASLNVAVDTRVTDDLSITELRELVSRWREAGVPPRG
jgi:phage terminase small subunit